MNMGFSRVIVGKSDILEYGFPMGYFWVSFGLFLGFVWVIGWVSVGLLVGFHLGYFWVSLGLLKNEAIYTNMGFSWVIGKKSDIHE